jgi:hypothetical protein
MLGKKIYEDSDYILVNEPGPLGITWPILTSFHVHIKSRNLSVKATGKEKQFLLAVVGEMTRLGLTPQQIKISSLFREFSESVPTRGGARWQLFFNHTPAKELAQIYAST